MLGLGSLRCTVVGVEVGTATRQTLISVVSERDLRDTVGENVESCTGKNAVVITKLLATEVPNAVLGIK